MLKCANPKCKWNGILTTERTGLDHRIGEPVCGLCRTVAVHEEVEAVMNSLEEEPLPIVRGPGLDLEVNRTDPDEAPKSKKRSRFERHG